jgi:membrane-associated phospholipid phosphatase
LELDLNYPNNQLTKQQLIRISTFVLFTFIVALTITVYGSDVSHYTNSQVSFFVKINHNLQFLPQTTWNNLTYLGDALILFPLLSFLVVKNPQALAAMFGSIPLATILSHVGKSVFSIPRPAAVIDHNQFTIIGNALTSNTSLPSGHTITIFTAVTAVLCVLLINKKMRRPYLYASIILGLALLIALSRVAVGAHWPTDLLLGAILGFYGGLSGAFLTYQYKAWWAWLAQPSLTVSATLLIFPAVLIAFLLDNEYPHLFVIWLSIIMAGFISVQVFRTSRL